MSLSAPPAPARGGPCGRPRSSPTPHAQTPPYFIIIVARTYVVQSNQTSGSGTQVLTYSGTSFTITAQTSDKSTSVSPASYPSAFIGNNNDWLTADSNLPLKISAISSVQSSWSWSDDGVTGIYNAVYDLWFTNTASGNIASPDKHLMIWLYKPNAKAPRGSIIGSSTVPGVPGTWTVWSDGTRISYVSTSTIHSLSCDLKGLISDSVSRGLLTSSMYLHDVFAGFEIWSGGVGLHGNCFTAGVN